MRTEKYLLLVDDEDTCHFLSRRLLSSLEFDGEIIDACDGIEAVEHIKENGSPEMILLDIRMPRMDGYEFLCVLASGELGAPPPVCVVTSSARPEDQQLDHQYSFVKACTEKPLMKSSLPVIADMIGAGYASDR